MRYFNLERLSTLKFSTFLIAFLTLAFDQITKLVIKNTLFPGEVIKVIPGFFNIVYVFNKGIAFGILNREGYHFYILIFLTLISIIFLIYLSTTSLAYSCLGRIGIGLVLGGAMGNFVDRIFIGKVVDFLDFYFHSFHWPAFNIADSAITCGAIMFFLSSIKRN